VKGKINVSMAQASESSERKHPWVNHIPARMIYAHPLLCSQLHKGFKISDNHLECVHTLQTKVPEANSGLLVAVHQLWLPDT
jgi:hypothetical protein